MLTLALGAAESASNLGKGATGAHARAGYCGGLFSDAMSARVVPKLKIIIGLLQLLDGSKEVQRACR